MIVKEIFYGIKCDRCGEIYEGSEFSFWGDESEAYEHASDDEWKEINNKHYCPCCYIINEETDEIIIKDPFPEHLIKLIKFLEKVLNIRTHVEEIDNKFIINFYLYNPICLIPSDEKYIRDMLNTNFISMEYMRDDRPTYKRVKCKISIKK